MRQNASAGKTLKGLHWDALRKRSGQDAEAIMPQSSLSLASTECTAHDAWSGQWGHAMEKITIQFARQQLEVTDQGQTHELYGSSANYGELQTITLLRRRSPRMPPVLTTSPKPERCTRP